VTEAPRSDSFDHRLTRRQFAALVAVLALPRALAGCDPATNSGPLLQGSARLQSRPGTPTESVSPGSHALGLATGRDGLLFVPSSYSAATPTPLVLALHGSAGAAIDMIDLLSSYATANGFLVLAVDSRNPTWDGIQGTFGVDVAFIDSALAWAFQRCNVDPNRVIVDGVSDGATYSIALALPNGDLFRRSVAHSPAAIHESNAPRVGKPEFFVSHGVNDIVIPVERSRNDIVPTLRADGYTVEYLEFDGGHEVPPAVAQAAVTWFLRP
jgi:phospholipase/carboxylesterase